MTTQAQAGRWAIAIMAAGKGTRLRSKRPKVLHAVGGKPLVEHVIRAAAQCLPARDIVVIVGHEAESVRRAVAHTGVRFALQPEQRGTGHAIRCAQAELAGYDQVLVLSGDVPLIRRETIETVRETHRKQKAAMTILTATPADPTGYGRVVRKSRSRPDVKAIIEQKALTPGQHKDQREINTGIYAFAAKGLWANIGRLTTDNAHREYYLTDLAALLVKGRKRVVAVRAERDIEVLGANTLAELAELDAEMRRAKCRELMAAGVTVVRPDTCLIDAEVEVGADTVIEPWVQITGRTRIGEDCRVRSFSVIQDSELGRAVLVRPGCVLDQAKVGEGATLGPYAHLRPGSEIGEGAHVGNFVETKKARLGKGAKANHLTYLGDAEIGAGVNVGAGTITCNYDGVHKHLTVIEEGAFIGSDSTLVAPVRIGKGAYVGAGSCITEDVPADALALGRARQAVKEGWAKKRRG
jgi:bifunctional UDP-N-acetylglucosamine pyrophosphorylase/glucosamine-1-phosphate N-acetyltransferase